MSETVPPESEAFRDSLIRVVDGNPPPADPVAEAQLAEGERALSEATEEEQTRLRQLRAETLRTEAEARKIEADTERIRAETERIRAEVELAGVKKKQAQDDRWMRIVAAGATFAVVVGWLWWMSDLIMLNSDPRREKPHMTPVTVQVALIANAAVALIGLFAVILRGLFQSPKDDVAGK